MEVVQEALAKTIRGRFEFRGEGSDEGWVWTIVVNVARSVTRQIVPEARVEETSGVAVTNGQPGEWPELRAAVAALPERQRLAVFLRHYADLDYAQVGDVLQIEHDRLGRTALRPPRRRIPRCDRRARLRRGRATSDADQTSTTEEVIGA